MSQLYDILPVEDIRKWLKGLVGQGRGVKSNKPTLKNIEDFIGNPGKLHWIAYKPSKNDISVKLQKQLSRCIALVQNGQLRWEWRAEGPDKRHKRKVAILDENPKPIVQYQVQIGRHGPRLMPKDRPRPVVTMPSFSDVFKR